MFANAPRSDLRAAVDCDANFSEYYSLQRQVRLRVKLKDYPHLSHECVETARLVSVQGTLLVCSQPISATVYQRDETFACAHASASITCDRCDIAGLVHGMMLSEYHVLCYPLFISPKLIPVLDFYNTTYSRVRSWSLDHVPRELTFYRCVVRFPVCLTRS
jgi:hypothetical protein